ncbi:hypothetical protein [Pseudomonas graminis]
MTELEKDLLANGFSEKDLKKFRRARERAKQEEQFEGDNDLDYDFTLRREIDILGSCFLWVSSAMLFILILLNTSSISKTYSLLKIIESNILITVSMMLCINFAIPLRLGFKSWRYRVIKSKKK